MRPAYPAGRGGTLTQSLKRILDLVSGMLKQLCGVFIIFQCGHRNGRLFENGSVLHTEGD